MNNPKPSQPTCDAQPVLRCIWCGQDTRTKPCEHCQNYEVVDRTQPHVPHWSRRTLDTVCCKICDREVRYDEHGYAEDLCRPEPIAEKGVT
jgi:hypothetical protein